MQLTNSSPFAWQVLAARWYEQFFGQLAASHLCVSTAMQQFLKAEWGIAATVFRDTPPHWFHRTSVQERHELFTRIAAHLNISEDLGLNIHYAHSQPQIDTEQVKEQQTKDFGVSYAGHNNFTHLVCQQPQLKCDRPALIVSSTSWTVDEDFQIMLDAAVQYEEVSISFSAHYSPYNASQQILCLSHSVLCTYAM